MKILDKLPIFGILAIGAMSVFIIPILNFLSIFTTEIKMDGFQKGVIMLLGVILSSLGLERYKTKENIEKKLDDIIFLHSKAFVEVFTTTENIIYEMEEALVNAERIVRATSFMKKQKGDVYENYYKKLSDKLLGKNDNFHYYCCYSEGIDFETRKRVFIKKDLGLKEKEKMTYFECTGIPSLNILIIDENIAFISYPVTEDNKQISFSLKLKVKSKDDDIQRVIHSLISWYDNVLKAHGVKKEYNSIFS